MLAVDTAALAALDAAKYRFNWTHERKRTFIQILDEEVKKEGATGNGFDTQVWERMRVNFNEKASCDLSKQQLQSQYSELKKRYKAWISLKVRPGFQYDEETGIYQASEDSWKEVIFMNKYASEFRTRPLPYADLLENIFGNADDIHTTLDGARMVIDIQEPGPVLTSTTNTNGTILQTTSSSSSRPSRKRSAPDTLGPQIEEFMSANKSYNSLAIDHYNKTYSHQFNHLQNYQFKMFLADKSRDNSLVYLLAPKEEQIICIYQQIGLHISPDMINNNR